jgi:hypothetical protein
LPFGDKEEHLGLCGKTGLHDATFVAAVESQYWRLGATIKIDGCDDGWQVKWNTYLGGVGCNERALLNEPRYYLESCEAGELHTKLPEFCGRNSFTTDGPQRLHFTNDYFP